MSNQIKLTFDISDELLDKLLTVMAITSQQNALGGAMPMYPVFVLFTRSPTCIIISPSYQGGCVVHP